MSAALNGNRMVAPAVSPWYERAGKCPICSWPIRVDQIETCKGCGKDLTESEKQAVVKSANERFKKSSITAVVFFIVFFIIFYVFY